MRKGEGGFEEGVGGGGNAMCAGLLTLTGRDDLLSPDDAGLDGAASPDEEASAVAAVDRVPPEAAVVFIGAPDEATPDPAAVDAVVASAEVFVVAAASTQ